MSADGGNKRFVLTSIYNLNPTRVLTVRAKNTGAWKGRLKRFFVDLYPVGLAKNGTNIN